MSDLLWVKSASNPLIEPADVGQNQIGYPTVIRAEGRLSNPIDAWYLWCAPHDDPGNIYLFTGPHPEGPWTIANSGSPVIATSSLAGAGHISSPFVLWNPNTSDLMLWAHAGTWGYPSGDGFGAQRNYLWRSTNGFTWTIQNNGTPVLGGTETNGDGDDRYAGYLNVVRNAADDGFIGYYQGYQYASPAGERICSATSTDGVTWARENVGSGHKPWPQGESYYRPVPYWRNGVLEVVYTLATPGPAHIFEKSRNGETDHSNDRTLELHEGSSGYDAGGIIPGDIIWYDGRLWLFCTAHATAGTSVGDTVAVTYKARAQEGFDTSWGKG